MSYSNNNFTRMNLNYSSSEEECFDGYSFVGGNQPISGPSNFQDWYRQPSTEGYADQTGYQGYTVLEDAGCRFENPHTTFADRAHDNWATAMNSDSLATNEQSTYAPVEYARPSVADLATAPSRVPPTSHPNNNPSLQTANIPRYRALEPQLAGLSMASHWTDVHPPASVDKGKARATDRIPHPHAMPTADDVWRYRQPRYTETHMAPTPQMVPSVPPNTDFPSPIAPSHGPQRSEGAKVRGKTTWIDKGKRARGSPEPVPEAIDSSWEQTKDRFVWELLDTYYFRPAGRSINPETAFAHIIKFIKEDLHRSPLADQTAAGKEEKRESRLYEHYLVHILKELRRSKRGEIQNEVDVYRQGKRPLTAFADTFDADNTWLFTVLEELESELAPVNGRRVLREGHVPNRGPNGSGDSTGKAKHRGVEQARRSAIRDLQERLSLYFWVPGQRKISAKDLLLYIVVYLRIGRVAFPGLIHPLLTKDGQQN
ncbi:hypothetical protein BJ322DRAFT_1211751 [Thelephora terrestris]|uniref:Uncharacterized protein n=1 Tax=Thelephora terrestris TaxID=56493 RepID=A0A9P6HE33_9AGAM|nr:hypothetical protein BJ322DRAFT_1211751 [Thelephora terrestris]